MINYLGLTPKLRAKLREILFFPESAWAGAKPWWLDAKWPTAEPAVKQCR